MEGKKGREEVAGERKGETEREERMGERKGLNKGYRDGLRKRDKGLQMKKWDVVDADFVILHDLSEGLYLSLFAATEAR